MSIGGNTAMFSLVNALFLQPLPIAAPQEIVRIYTGESTVSWPDLDDIRRRNTVLTDVVAQGQSRSIAGGRPAAGPAVCGTRLAELLRRVGRPSARRA